MFDRFTRWARDLTADQRRRLYDVGEATAYALAAFGLITDAQALALVALFGPLFRVAKANVSRG